MARPTPVHIEPWVARAAAARPHHPAIAGDGSLSYEALLERARAVAGALSAAGVRSGDRVALALPGGADVAVALHACLLLGAAAVPVDLRLPEPERERRAAGAALVLSDLPAGPPVAVPAGMEAGAVATVMHTSGTTGAARPVGLTVSNWLWNALGSALALGLDPAERWLCALPLAHVGGLSILIRSAVYGTTAVVHDGFDAGRAVGALTEDRITLASLVPTMLARLLDAGLRHPPHLRCALLGGAPAPPALLARARDAGVPVAHTYGLTETCSQVATSPPGEPGTCGPPLAGTRVRIARDGEVLVAGPTVAPGVAGADGWLRTGDLGVLDARGRLTITGRRADTIVTGGENVSPAAVEAVLLEHPALADAAVHGRPDARWGEAVVASVVVRAGAAVTEEDLRAHCAARLAGFQVPKAFAFVAALPRTASGKLRRGELG